MNNISSESYASFPSIMDCLKNLAPTINYDSETKVLSISGHTTNNQLSNIQTAALRSLSFIGGLYIAAKMGHWIIKDLTGMQSREQLSDRLLPIGIPYMVINFADLEENVKQLKDDPNCPQSLFEEIPYNVKYNFKPIFDYTSNTSPTQIAKTALLGSGLGLAFSYGPKSIILKSLIALTITSIALSENFTKKGIMDVKLALETPSLNTLTLLEPVPAAS